MNARGAGGSARQPATRGAEPFARAQPKAPKRICIDIDGTICTLRSDTGDYDNARPLPGAVETINRWFDDGHHIILYTARRMRTHDGDVDKVIADIGPLTRDWLARHGVRYHQLIFGKPYAHVYIDDLAKRFEGDWNEVSSHVEGIARVESDPGDGRP